MTENNKKAEPRKGSATKMAYEYEIEIVHRTAEGKIKAQHTFNGPHDAELSSLSGKMDTRLEHLAPNPANPNTVRLKLTFTDQ
jgi:hypothetical protein